MSDPVKVTHSLEELRSAAYSFMQDDYGRPDKDDREAREEWYERLGLLVCFAAYLLRHPPANNS